MVDITRLPTTFDGKLDHVIEECSEVIKAIIKIKRFGLYSYDPNDPTRKTNKEHLYDEIQDVQDAITRLHAEFNSIKPSQVANI